MPPPFSEKLTLTSTFSLPDGLRGIISEPVTLEFLSSNVFYRKQVVSNGVMISNTIWFKNIFQHQSLIYLVHIKVSYNT